MRKTATRIKSEKFSPGEKFTPSIEKDTKLKADFAKVIHLYPAKLLAEAADCSVDTVKCWKARRSFPHGTHLMRLVADFPEINAWHSRRTGGLNNPRAQVEVYAELERILGEDSAKGRAMRARYHEIVRGAQ